MSEDVDVEGTCVALTRWQRANLGATYRSVYLHSRFRGFYHHLGGQATSSPFRLHDR